jgi:RNA recognition motif-containing protein
MSAQSIEIVEKGTFLDFFVIGDGNEIEGDHRPVMCHAKTEPSDKNAAAVKRVQAYVQSSASSSSRKSSVASVSTSASTDVSDCPSESASSPRSRGSSKGQLWADITEDEATSISTSAPIDVRKLPPKESAVGAKSLKSEDTRTTLMLRNVPNDYNRDMFLDMLDDECLAGEYDFVYFPMDFHTGSGLGYAFVNFTSHEEALRAWQLLDNFSDWQVPSTKTCEVRWSTPVQGYKANVQRYRNSPMMHHQVPDVYKPVVFSNGLRAEYPAPKKPIKYMPAKKVSKNRK